MRTINADDWQRIENRLEKSGLLLGKKGSFDRHEWDTHPMIRGYFRQKFKENHPDNFRQAHLVLFKYFKSVPLKQTPESLEDMQPLYRAVIHGCLAERHYIALTRVYKRRISHHSTKNLFAFSQNLTALSFFFQQPWSKPTQELSRQDQVWLLQTIAYCLQSLGRIIDAKTVRELCLELHLKQNNFKDAANDAENLFDLAFSRGELKIATKYAKDAMDYATKANHDFKYFSSQGRFAIAHYFMGKIHDARVLFEINEHLSKERKIIKSMLTSFIGARYCNFILDTSNDKSDFTTVMERGNYTLKVAQNNEWKLETLFSHLFLARLNQSLQNFKEAEEQFSLALNGLQETNFNFWMPEFLLTRAYFYIDQGRFDSADHDLNGALEIIKQCSLKLYEVDYLLAHGLYCLVATCETDTALRHHQEAEQLIDETGYHLRDAELYLFAAQICQQTKNGKLNEKYADFYLQKAKTRIQEIGQWVLKPRWEKLAGRMLNSRP